jgi:hypothetical protein
MGRRRKNIFYYTPAIGWGILICYFSLMPSNEVPGFLLDAKDILLHFLIYFFFTLLLFFGANKFSSRFLLGYRMAIIVLTSIVLGVAIELIQENFIDGRHFEWGDILFNTLGTLVILPINRILKKR